MSDHVELCADGIFVHKWNGKKREFVRKRAKKNEICSHLRKNCEIAPGTTLGQIFSVVDKYKFLKKVISQYSWCHAIDEFHIQALELIQKDEDDNEKMTHLEIYWHVENEIYTENIKHPGGLRERIKTADFEIQPSFHGIGPCKEGQDYRGNGLEHYSVSYSPMYDLADLPVVLKRDFDVYTPWSSEKKPEKILSSKREFTLLQVLDAIYWDISFNGGPTDNKAFIEEMNKRVEEIKSGEIPMIPLKQVGKRIGFDFNTDEDTNTDEKSENDMKILLHPDVVKFFGVDPNDIPLDDKEIIRPGEE